ncbi:MAG: hypothetical protein ACRYFS_03185 [Janthinobacterium lividum]
MSTQTLEVRVEALETKIERLEQKEQDKGKQPRGWQRIVGVFAGDPEFEEAVKSGTEWRASENETSMIDRV